MNKVAKLGICCVNSCWEIISICVPFIYLARLNRKFVDQVAKVQNLDKKFALQQKKEDINLL